MKSKFISAILAILVLLSFITVYADNLDSFYISEDFWNNNPSINTTVFDIRSENANGECRYFFDSINNAIYFRFDFTSNIDYSKIKINFNFNDGSNNNFSVSQNGMCDFAGNEDENYKVIYSFDVVPMIGIEIPKDSYVNYLTIKFNYQGRNDIVMKNVVFDATPITTTKLTTTKTTTIKQTTKIVTTKKNSKYVTKPAKFTTNLHQSAVTSSTNEELTTTEVYSYGENDVVKSSKRIITATLGAVAIVISIVFLIIHFVRRKKSS